ncbi:MAG: TRAP transporter small permease [bacterium]
MKKLWRIWQKAIDLLLMSTFILLVIFASLPIFTRLLGLSGFAWALPASNQLVLWLALTGAIFAERLDKHISISLLPEQATSLLNRIRKSFIYSFSILVLGYLFWFSLKLLMDEYQYATDALFGLPSWFWMSIIPFALINMCFEKLVQIILVWHKV